MLAQLEPHGPARERRARVGHAAGERRVAPEPHAGGRLDAQRDVGGGGRRGGDEQERERGEDGPDGHAAPD